MRTPKNQKNIFGSKSTGLLERWRKLFPDQLWKILTMKFFDRSHSRYVPLRAELVLLRGGLPSEIALQVINCVSKGRCRFRKNRKLVSKKLWTNFDLENIWSQSFSIRTSKGRAPASRARVAKERPAFRDRITRGKPRVQNCVSRGRCRLRKTVNIFSVYNDRVTWNVEKSGFQKIWKILT